MAVDDGDLLGGDPPTPLLPCRVCCVLRPMAQQKIRMLSPRWCHLEVGALEGTPDYLASHDGAHRPSLFLERELPGQWVGSPVVLLASHSAITARPRDGEPPVPPPPPALSEIIAPWLFGQVWACLRWPVCAPTPQLDGPSQGPQPGLHRD